MRAKKRFRKQMLALLLSAVMIAEPATSAAVTYAAEPVTGQTVDSVEDASEMDEQDTVKTEAGKDETDPGKTDGEEGGSEETGGDETDSDETGSEESGSDETGSDENDGEDQETDQDGEDADSEEELPADEIEEEDPEEDADAEDTVSGNDLEEEEDKDNWRGTGHKAPELEMQLTSAMVSEKRELKGTADRLQVLEKNVHYIANEAVFLADSQKYAETVAQGYGASLESCEEGVAVMTFPDEVTDIIAMAEDEKVKLPAVYPNYYYTIFEDIVAYFDELPTDENSIMSDSNDEFLNPNAGNWYQYHHDEIKSKEAWDYNDAAGNGIKVAVIDSGIQKNHEDLKGRVASAAVTYSTPYNKTEDNNGHGTHVSGIIAANRNNDVGGAGVAYKASIVSIKAMEQNTAIGTAGGSTAGIIKAVNTAVKSGSRVINMSLGGTVYDQLYEAAINTAVNKGIVVVAAAGNDGKKLSKTYGENNYFVSPACFDNVITVSAKQKGSNTKASFSNYGSGIIDITAPGTDIVSSVPGDYRKTNGTSQAAPMVAAAAAYILSVSPDLKNNKTKSTVDTVKKILQDSATKTGYANKDHFGEGLLNVEAAVKMAAPAAADKGGTGELTAPAVKIGAADVKNKDTIQDTDMITLSATVGGAANNQVKIYYTLNGKAPTDKSDLYTAPFSIPASGTKTIKAIAVYYGKKSKVTSIQVKVNAKMTSFVIASKTNSNCLGAGKSMNLVVDAKSVQPTYATNKAVTWAIVDYGTANLSDAQKAAIATITANGQLKAGANIQAKTIIKVRATAKDDNHKTADKTITLLPKVESLTMTAPVLTDKKPYPLTYASTAETVQMTVAVTPADANTGISYTTSNAKVASVSPTGLITAVGNGKATITAKTTDGSNKKVTLSVQVTKKVQSITVTSKTKESQIAAGKTLQMVAEVTSDATNKNVTWSVVEGDAAAATIDKNGKLTAKRDVTAVSTVTVKAEAKDESGKSGTMTITVYPSTTTKIAFEEAGTSCNLGTTKMGSLLTSIQLHPYTDGYTTTYFGRKKDSGTTGLGNFIYTSSNKNIAEVNSTGLVTANANGKTGTAKIKVAAKDGSGKSATYTVKVVKPVTSLAIYSKTGSVVVGRNKTLVLGASVGGNASNKKLKWTSSDPSIATVDQSGKVKGISYDSAKLESMVTITAEATDGSGVWASYPVWVQPAITKLMYRYKSGFRTGWSASVVTTTYLSDAPKITLEEAIKTGIKNDKGDLVTVYDNYYLADMTPFYFDEYSKDTYRTYVDNGVRYRYWDWDSVSYTCSNSNVIQIVRVQVSGGYVYFWIPVNKGTATLTFKALDGSGKSAKIKITVK